MLSTDIDWDNAIRYLREGKLTPVISNQVVNKAFIGSEHVANWADEIEYPLADTDNLIRVAQFLSVTTHDPAGAKRKYLEFLSKRWLELARADPNADKRKEFLDNTEKELAKLSFSELATERLTHPNFKEDVDHPLRILADMDIKIYLTTSHHGFMEAALRAAGKKEFRSEVYCWCEQVKKDVPKACQPDLKYEPSVEKPLIYHLHGLDHYPDSIVLTEDDHLQFMASIIKEFGKTDFTPGSVRTAVTNSFLLLLGYEPHSLDLSVILHGILKSQERHHRGFSIQLDPLKMDSIRYREGFQRYLQDYFGEAKIDVWWGTLEEFMITLKDKWQGP